MAERKKALAAEADIYVINCENLQWLVEQSGVPFNFDMVVLDELSSFKNWNSKRFEAFMKLPLKRGISKRKKKRAGNRLWCPAFQLSDGRIVFLFLFIQNFCILDDLVFVFTDKKHFFILNQ